MDPTSSGRRAHGPRKEEGDRKRLNKWPQGFFGVLSFGQNNTHKPIDAHTFRIGGRKLLFLQLCHLQVIAHEGGSPQ